MSLLTSTIPLSNHEAQKRARVIRALADPARLQILHILKHRGGAVTVAEIVKEFDLSQPTISHHLHLLLSADLISYRKSGFNVFYTIEAVKLAEVGAWLRDLQPEKKEARHVS